MSGKGHGMAGEMLAARAKALAKPESLPGWLAFLWRWIDNASNVQFLANVWNWFGSSVTGFMHDWGWAVGVGWLAYLVAGHPVPSWFPKWPKRTVGTPRAATFHAQSVRATIAEVHLAGLVTDAEADEAIEIVMNVDNYSGFPVRIVSVSGFIMIFGDRKRPKPTIANLPIDLPPIGPRPLTLIQETPGLRGVIFQKGMYGGGIMPFNLGNLEVKCVATMADGTTQEGVCALPESHFLVRGPLDIRDPADFAAMQRVSITYGSNRYYGADGRNEEG